MPWLSALGMGIDKDLRAYFSQEIKHILTLLQLNMLNKKGESQNNLRNHIPVHTQSTNSQPWHYQNPTQDENSKGHQLTTVKK